MGPSRCGQGKTLLHWQDCWTDANTGRWTARLIGEVAPWFNRTYGEVLYIIQFLTGHGHFNSYFHRRKRKDSPLCEYCGDLEEDAEHTFFVCDRWVTERRILYSVIGEKVIPESMVTTMLRIREIRGRVRRGDVTAEEERRTQQRKAEPPTSSGDRELDNLDKLYKKDHQRRETPKTALKMTHGPDSPNTISGSRAL